MNQYVITSAVVLIFGLYLLIVARCWQQPEW